jgi:hypothetical protein
MTLDTEDDETYEWSVDSAYVRIKDPVGVDIK